MEFGYSEKQLEIKAMLRDFVREGNSSDPE